MAIAFRSRKPVFFPDRIALVTNKEKVSLTKSRFLLDKISRCISLADRYSMVGDLLTLFRVKLKGLSTD